MSFWDQVKATAADIGEKAQEGAANLKVKADQEIEKAKQSEAWAKAKKGSAEAWEKTKQGSQSAWVGGQAVARNVHSQAKTALNGKLNTVTFHEPKLGMTLARDEKTGQAVVSRVDANGPAASGNVGIGDKVISMRSGYETDGSGEPAIKVESYDHLMGLFPAMGRPVTITFQEPRDGGELFINDYFFWSLICVERLLILCRGYPICRCCKLYHGRRNSKGCKDFGKIDH
jgi:hypothetical protein